MSTNATTTLWVGKEKGVWKTLAITPSGSACPVTKRPERRSSGWSSGFQRKGSKEDEPRDKVAPSTPRATGQQKGTQNRSNIKALAAVACEFAERDCPELLATTGDTTSSGTSEGESADNGASMDLDNLSELTELTSDDGADDCGSVYADSEF